jgi:hypothetical protein
MFPNWVLRPVALRVTMLKQILPGLGKVKHGSNDSWPVPIVRS